MALANAWARIHRSNQRHLGWKADRALGSANRDHPIFERLPQDLQDVLAELRHLVEEQHAPVRQADLARSRPAAASRESSMAGRMDTI